MQNNNSYDNGHNAETMYLERYAKELLEQLFPDDYRNIEMDDAPDLRMGQEYGIEVTWAMFDHQGQANGILDHIKGQKTEQIDPRYLQTMDRIDAEPLITEEGKIGGYFPHWGNGIRIQELIKAYQSKKSKANNYKTKLTDLFIYPPLAQIDGWLGEEMIRDFFSLIHQDKEKPFHSIIVYEEPTLYLYDISKDQTKKSRGSQNVIYQCKKVADEYSGWSKRMDR